jgi:type I restriction enzyme R subunit
MSNWSRLSEKAPMPSRRMDDMRRNARIDWTIKESVWAQIRVMVKRILKKYGYPPDKQEKATITMLEQAEVLCKDWAA